MTDWRRAGSDISYGLPEAAWRGGPGRLASLSGVDRMSGPVEKADDRLSPLPGAGGGAIDGERDAEFRTADCSAADSSAKDRASCVPTDPFRTEFGGRMESSCVGGGGG